ncbi:signal transduction histidine kinase [Pelomonas saccharophila]|uniref:histidine kinase n=1 Tax=Roseateles saccharophilus TaxID=304 RepID=A0ABU1YLL4_ROSSA|nr:sensor histidine kinase [Roseateles saccharophilus]MDR7269742.1 signal transduction histidine kinase [Roseateles saccharophilus]
MQAVEHLALSAYLKRRRGVILQAWRTAVTADPSLTTGAALPRAQLHDHIPALLVDFERKLASGASTAAEAPQRTQGDAAAHGLHRWQQGFDLAEVTRELGRLNECVVVELEAYAVENPGFSPPAMADARRIWAQQCGEAISASVSQYFQLQQIEASSHIRDLEQALQSLRELELERARLWQEAAHDLRGNLGVVATATAGLASPQASELMRGRFLRLLDRNVGSLSHLLNDVTSLARLQGGLEHLQMQSIDAVALLAALCEDLQPHAQERGLYLRFDGPPTLAVEGDAVKTRRIAQNLIINAIKYTRTGGVTVSCGDGASSDLDRWFFEVRDTGPGFHAGPGSELAGAIEEATDQARQVATDHATGVVTHMSVDLTENYPSPKDSRPVGQQVGEGIGLSIVKRLCDLLNATTELESEIGVGTVFRILLPRSYGDGHAAQVGGAG